MKYSTPELYSAGQPELCPDDAAVEKSLDDWDKSMEQYGLRLKEIKDKLPASVKKFMEICFLHDADVRAEDNWSFSPTADHIQIIARQEDCGDHRFLCVLRYEIAPAGHIPEGIVQKMHRGVGFYDPVEHKNLKYIPHWLYDEWDYVGNFGGQDVFNHSFLMSNGMEMNIYFTKFSFMYIPFGKDFIEG